MTPPNSKYIPFIVLLIVSGLFAIDIFTAFEINDGHIQLIAVVLTPLGMGGLINKGWDTYKAIKTKQE